MTTEHSTDTGVDWFDKFISPRLEVSPEGCWLWPGAHGRGGYGTSGPAKRATGTSYIHRAIWIALNYQPPPKHEVDHTCFVPACVNPAHLRLLTAAQNRQIGRRNEVYLRPICPKGHAKTGDNALSQHGGASVVCRICTTEQMRASQARRKEKKAAYDAARWAQRREERAS